MAGDLEVPATPPLLRWVGEVVDQVFCKKPTFFDPVERRMSKRRKKWRRERSKRKRRERRRGEVEEEEEEGSRRGQKGRFALILPFLILLPLFFHNSPLLLYLCLLLDTFLCSTGA